MKSFIKNIFFKIPVLGKIVDFLQTSRMNKKFPGSEQYWEARYREGRDSGAGSYNRLAEFKANVLNSFVSDKKVLSVIEYGCGDGNNLALVKYPKYTGLDVSKTAIDLCRDKFKSDNTKSFYVYSSLATEEQKLFQAELSLSLDVIYHLIEDEIYKNYMKHLFQSAQRYVIIYARDYDEKQTYHEKSRKFTEWIEKNQKAFHLIRKIENPYRFDPKDPSNTSNADFFIYERQN